MGRSLNKVTLIGTLGRDPEVKFMQDGKAVANLTLATDESYKDKSGNKIEQTEWHRLTAYDKLAEIIQQYLKKGSKVYVEGKLKTREWEKDGVKRYTTEIVMSHMIMLSANPNAAQGSAPQQQSQQPQQGQWSGNQNQGYAPQSMPNNSFDDFDDDIPFSQNPPDFR